MLQLHLSDQQFYCLLRCDLYEMFYGSQTQKQINLYHQRTPWMKQEKYAVNHLDDKRSETLLFMNCCISMKTRLCHNKHQCYLGWFDNDWHESWISVFMQMRRKMCNRLKTKISQRERLLFSLEITLGSVQKSETLQWRHNDRDGVSNHPPHHWLFNRRSKKTPKLCVTGLVSGIHRRPVNSPHKGPVTWKMFWWRHHEHNPRLTFSWKYI